MSTVSPFQHFQRGKGTDSSPLQHIVIPKAAQEAAFDQKAFGSVGKPTIRLAWTRLGGPPDVVEWTASPDEHPNIIHVNPHSQAHWPPHHDHSISQQHAEHPNSPHKLTVERGVGQGAGLNLVTWNALISILLRSLEIVSSHHQPPHPWPPRHRSRVTGHSPADTLDNL
eukprot:gene62034-biopygen40129